MGEDECGFDDGADLAWAGGDVAECVPAADVVAHCVTERQAHQVRQPIGRRFADIGLQLHPDKTRIVYCKDDRRRLDVERVTFTFCGYAFRPRKAWDKIRGKVRTGFLPAVAPGS
jgi:RNA-directed DNA polymerase